MTSSDQSIINQNSPDSIAKKLNSFIDNLNTKSILVIVLLIFLLNSNSTKIMEFINIQNIIFICIITIVIYFYLKKLYSSKITSNNITQEFQQKNNMLDKLCSNNPSNSKNKEICEKYKTANINYNLISDLLLKNIS